jgi:lysine 6-dehydrogenase
MRMLVLGAGLQGSACAYDLLQQLDVERVTLADARPGPLPAFLRGMRGRRLTVVRLNVEHDARLRRLMRGHDAVLSALPFYHNPAVARAAVDCGLHHADLGGNTEIVVKQKRQLHRRAARRGLSVIPDCGLAPGLVNILAGEGIRRVRDTDSVKIYVGGLPQHPEPPLNYHIVYSLEGAIDYYTTPSLILRGGALTRVEALSEVEAVEFAPPVGTLEAFHTGGGISVMPLAWQGRIGTMEYKTLRYPGHAEIMRAIRELGLLGTRPVKVGRQTIVPREAFIAVVSPRLTKPRARDLVALRVEVRGRSGRCAAWELIDWYDETRGVSAMMRTTGYSLSITGIMQVEGQVLAHGVHTPDEAVPFDAYVRELGRRGIEVRQI